MNRSGKLAFAIGIFAACLVGCKSTDMVTAAHTERVSRAVKGWTQIKSAGVSLSLPSDLPVIDMTSRDLDKIAAGVKLQFPNNPDAERMASQAMSQGNMKLLAMEKTPSSPGFRNNFMLISVAVPKVVTIEALLQETQAQLKKLVHDSTAKGALVTLPAGKAAYIEADISNAAIKYATTSYMLIHDGNQFVFTFTCGLSNKQKWRETAKKAMESMRFTP